MRILLTRPREDSEKLASRLEAMGHHVVIEPVIAIRFESDAPVDLDGVQALLFTSVNGVRAFAQRAPTRDLPVFAVGDATAAAAHEFGFTHVESAGGDVTDLARLVREHLRAQNGVLLHAAGSVVAGDLAGALGEAGFAVRRAVLYRADPAELLSVETKAALDTGQIDVVTFFSPRSASIFADLVRKAGLASACAQVVMVGLSPAVASAAELPWRRREIAAAPNEAALVDVIAKLAGSAPDRDASAPETESLRSPVAAVRTSSTQAPRAWLAPVGLALVLAVAALGWTAWRELNRPPDASAALLQIQQRIEALERESTARVAALERDVGARLSAAEQSRAAVTRNIDSVAARLGAVETRIAAVSKQLETTANQFEQLAQETRGVADPGRLAALTTENRRLAQELARLQEEVASMSGAMGERAEPRREAIVVAIAGLRDAIARGAPYAAELASARNLVAEDPNLSKILASLEPQAARGIPTRSALKAQFDRVATDIVRAASSSDGWRAWFGRLMSAVSIRPVGDMEGDTPGAIVARAERRVGTDDLAGAVAELGKLSGPGADAAQAWLTNARARVNAESALASATAQALKLGAEAKVAP